MNQHTTKEVRSRYRYVKINNSDAEEIRHLPRGASFSIYIGASEALFRALELELPNTIKLNSLKEAWDFFCHDADPEILVSGLFLESALLDKQDLFIMRRFSRSRFLSRAVIIGNLRGLTLERVTQLRNTGIFDDLIDFQVEQAIISDKLAQLCRIKNICLANLNCVKVEQKAQQIYGRSYIAKRILDVILASVSLVVALPIMVLVAIAIRLESRGPVFYNSYRAGRGYRIFKFYKFRTMKVGADRMIKSISHLNKYNNFGHAPVFFKADNDPRITAFGQFLRTYGLDELPQLFNVFMGDMSIVGNRPLPLYEACALTSDDVADRFSAPSGITGLWQVSCRTEGGQFDCSSRIAKDKEYSLISGLAIDFWIMLRTPVVLLRRTNSRIKVRRDVKPLITLEHELLKLQ